MKATKSSELERQFRPCQDGAIGHSVVPDGDTLERVGCCLHCPPHQTAAKLGLHTQRFVSGRRRHSDASSGTARSTAEARHWLISLSLPTPNRVEHRAEGPSRPRFSDFSWRLTRRYLCSKASNYHRLRDRLPTLLYRW